MVGDLFLSGVSSGSTNFPQLEVAVLYVVASDWITWLSS